MACLQHLTYISRLCHILGRFQCISTYITGQNIAIWCFGRIFALFCPFLDTSVTPYLNYWAKYDLPTTPYLDLKVMQHFRKVSVHQYYITGQNIAIWCFGPIFALFCPFLDTSVTPYLTYWWKYGLPTTPDLDLKVIQHFRKVPVHQYLYNWTKHCNSVFWPHFCSILPIFGLFGNAIPQYWAKYRLPAVPASDLMVIQHFWKVPVHHYPYNWIKPHNLGFWPNFWSILHHFGPFSNLIHHILGRIWSIYNNWLISHGYTTF